MITDGFFKLEKLKIIGYSDPNRGIKTGDFEALFNPESYRDSFFVIYSSAAVNKPTYLRTMPSELSLELILDGSGVNEYGIQLFDSQDNVKTQVKNFLSLCYELKGEIHQPRYLKIIWGQHLQYPCRLSYLDINYTRFDHSGDPLRAHLNVNFRRDESFDDYLKRVNLSSPDLTHNRTIKAGDTLPQMCERIYGSAKYYLRVAQVNKLDDFRNLTPGHTINFPPLEK